MAVPPCPVCSANTGRAAAIADTAAPVFSILRLIGSIIGVLLAAVRRNLLTFGAGRACTRRRRSDGTLEIGVRTRITMNRNMLGNIELQPLDIVVERYG